MIPGSKRNNEGIFYVCALLGSPRLSLVLVGMQVKEMSRKMGVSKSIVQCLFSPTLVIGFGYYYVNIGVFDLFPKWKLLNQCLYQK